jgi:DNA-binding transcriptional LysR family regulator
VVAGIDVACRVGELKDSRLIARCIGTAHRVTLAAPSYLEKHGEPQHPRDLLQHQCLVYAGLANVNEWVYGKRQCRHRCARGRAIPVQQFGSAAPSGLRGARNRLFAFMDLYGDDIRAGRVKPILTQYQPHSLPLNVVFQPARRPSLKVNSFMSYFAEAFSQDPDIADMLSAQSEAATVGQLDIDYPIAVEGCLWQALA